MSVRSGILAVLSLGPAYGSQVHAELESRTNRAGRINVGQIYSTLDRLQTQGRVQHDGVTTDGLPLYSLTALGRAEVEAWMLEVDTAIAWPDFVAHVLMVASLPGSPVDELIGAYRQVYSDAAVESDSASTSHDIDEPLAALGRDATVILARSALSWLDAVETVIASPGVVSRPLDLFRPRRGRRPRTAVDEAS